MSGLIAKSRSFFGFDTEEEPDLILDAKLSFFRLACAPKGERGFLLVIVCSFIAVLISVLYERAEFNRVCASRRGTFPLESDPSCEALWLANGMTLVSFIILLYLIVTIINTAIYHRVDVFETVPLSVVAQWALFTLATPLSFIALCTYFIYFEGARHGDVAKAHIIVPFVVILLLLLFGLNHCNFRHVFWSLHAVIGHIVYILILRSHGVHVYHEAKDLTGNTIAGHCILILFVTAIIHIFWITVYKLRVIYGHNGTMMRPKVFRAVVEATPLSVVREGGPLDTFA